MAYSKFRKKSHENTEPITVLLPIMETTPLAPSWDDINLYLQSNHQVLDTDDTILYARPIKTYNVSSNKVYVSPDDIWYAIEKAGIPEDLWQTVYDNTIKSLYNRNGAIQAYASTDDMKQAIVNSINALNKRAWNKLNHQELIDHIFGKTNDYVADDWQNYEEYLSPEELASIHYRLGDADENLTKYVEAKNKKNKINLLQYNTANKAALGLYDVYQDGQHSFNDVEYIRDLERAGRSGYLTDEEALILAPQMRTTYADALKVGEKNTEILDDNMRRKAEYKKAIQDALTAELTNSMRDAANKAAVYGVETLVNTPAILANTLYGVGLHNILHPEDKRNLGWVVDTQAGLFGGPSTFSKETNLFNNNHFAGKLGNFAADIVTDPTTWIIGAMFKGMNVGKDVTLKAGSGLINGSEIATAGEKAATKVLPTLSGEVAEATEEAAELATQKLTGWAAKAKALRVNAAEIKTEAEALKLTGEKKAMQKAKALLRQAKDLESQAKLLGQLAGSAARKANKVAKINATETHGPTNTLLNYAGTKTVNSAHPTNNSAMGEIFHGQTPASKLNNAIGSQVNPGVITTEYTTVNPQDYHINIPLAIPSWRVSGMPDSGSNIIIPEFKYNPIEKWVPQTQYLVTPKKRGGNPNPVPHLNINTTPTIYIKPRRSRQYTMDNLTNDPGLYDLGTVAYYQVNNDYSPRRVLNHTDKNVVTSPEDRLFVPTFDVGTVTRKNGGILNYLNYLN